MEGLSLGLIVVLLLILAAEFVNGWTDAPNAIATVISTRVLHPAVAVVMASLLNVVGAMSGTKVAATIAKDIVKPEAVDLATVAAAMLALVAWSTLASFYGLPTSETHALVAGMAGAGLATAGPQVLLWVGWKKVLVGLLFSTFLGFFGGWLIFLLVAAVFGRRQRHQSQKLFGKLQIFSAAFMAFVHGSNDGQKFIGAFMLALVLGGQLPQSVDFEVPLTVILLCSAIMGIGTSVGGWRIIKTMGMRMVRLEPHLGFAAETGAASTIQLASLTGIPVSTTHTINTSIMGVGAATRVSAVRWAVVREVVMAWILTFPVCGLLAWLIAQTLRLFK